MNSKNTDEWQSVEQIFLTYAIDGFETILEATVEAKGEARRVMAFASFAGDRMVIARWRDFVPASVRVVAEKTPKDQKQQYERLLMAYVAGTNPLRRPEKVDVDTRQPGWSAEGLRQG